jgi:hypothetical protein
MDYSSAEKIASVYELAMEKDAFLGSFKAKHRFKTVSEGGSGAVKNEYLRARDQYVNHPKPGNKEYFQKIHQLASEAGHPVGEWQKSEPEMTAGLLGVRPGSSR